MPAKLSVFVLDTRSTDRLRSARVRGPASSLRSDVGVAVDAEDATVAPVVPVDTAPDTSQEAR